MNKQITTIIFDWGRTIHDPERDILFEGVMDLIPEFAKKYTLTLVSLAKSDTPEGRSLRIAESGIAQFFQHIFVGEHGKDEMYEKLLAELQIDPSNIAVVDDRVVRGIAWGNRKGATTIWFQNGKFAEELPDEITGNPTHTITSFLELKNIL